MGDFKSRKSGPENSSLSSPDGALEIGGNNGGSSTETNSTHAETGIVVAENRMEVEEENVKTKSVQEDQKNIHMAEESVLEISLSRETIKESRINFLTELQGPPITFKLILDCKEKQSDIVEKEMVVEGDLLSQNVHKLKLCVESQHSIPACTQTITFDGCTLEDQELLSHYHIRNGDCLQVAFERRGDITDLMEVIDNMKEMYFFLKSLRKELRDGTLDKVMILAIQQKISPQEIENICRFYISFRLGKGQTNHMFFVDYGGLVVLRMLHEELLRYPLTHLPFTLQALEAAILSCYWNLTVDTLICKCLRMSRVLQNITKSFMRVHIDSDVSIKAPKNLYTGADHFRCRGRAESVAFKSLGVMCNLAEVPECYLKIASNKDVLDQIVATLSCPSYDSFYHLVCMGGMLSLSFYTNTHSYIASSSVLSGILKCCVISADILLQYFAIVLHAILLTTSPSLISTSVKKICLQFSRQFFDSTTYLEINKKERTRGFIWKTIVPYMIPAYHVYSHPQLHLIHPELNVFEIERLQRFCIQCGIFSLSNVLQSENMREIFLQEGLLDYLVCMPWLYPHIWPERKKAQQLVAFMGQHMQLQPPSLINITRAKVAGMYFGLDKVLKADVHELLTEAYA